MSEQNTPNSSAHSINSITAPRVSVEATINSDLPRLKTVLYNYFLSSRLHAKIQRTENDTTNLTVQGDQSKVIDSLKNLQELLKLQFEVAIVWSEPTNITEESRLNSVTIVDTLPELKRDPSSGVFVEKEFEEISFGGSATTENLKNIARQTFQSMMTGVRGVGIARGWIPETKKEHISVKLGDHRIDLEISTITSLDNLLKVIGERFKSAAPIKLIYRLEDNDVIIVNDVNDLRKDYLYYALNVNQELPKKNGMNSMEEFFEKLKTDEHMSDSQVVIAKDKFEAQGITFKQLMKSGELAITDVDLKEYGITQGGLRKAILAVIKSSQ